MKTQITDITRNDIKAVLLDDDYHWAGSYEEDEVGFLNRIYPLQSLPSHDSRFDSADRDIWQHRINNYDWEDDWVFEDERFGLMDGSDEVFLRFLTETVHPVVCPDVDKARALVDMYNMHLKYDGYQLQIDDRISGKPIYGYREIDPVDGIFNEELVEGVDYSDVWEEGIFRVFISHTAKWKAGAEELKKALQRYGIASFVAHTDVDPTLEWLQEIEKALKSMDLIVPMMTADFRESKWTDQEVGAAIGRNIPIFPIKVERDPHGFMGKIQAIVVDGRDVALVANDIVKGLIMNNTVSCSGNSAVDALLIAMGNAYNFDQGNMLATLLPYISSLSSLQEEKLVITHNKNSQIGRAWGFQDNVVDELERTTGHTYIKQDGMLVRV